MTLPNSQFSVNSKVQLPPIARRSIIDSVDIQEIRRKNLEVLVERVGNQRKLADLLGIEPSFISQLSTGGKKMGERFARTIEEKMNLPALSLDYADMQPESPQDMAILVDIIIGVLDAAEAAGERRHKELARVCAASYQVYLETGEVPAAAQALRFSGLLGAGRKD